MTPPSKKDCIIKKTSSSYKELSCEEIKEKIETKLEKAHKYLQCHRIRYAITCFEYAIYLQKILLGRSVDDTTVQQSLASKIAELYSSVALLHYNHLKDPDCANANHSHSLKYFELAGINDGNPSYFQAFEEFRVTECCDYQQEEEYDELEQISENYLRLAEVNIILNNFSQAKQRLDVASENLGRISHEDRKERLRAIHESLEQMLMRASI